MNTDRMSIVTTVYIDGREGGEYESGMPYWELHSYPRTPCRQCGDLNHNAITRED